jgi:hypothetical protein
MARGAPPPGGRKRTAAIQLASRALIPEGLHTFEQLEAAEYLSRLAADEDLIRLLQLGRFDTATPEWNEFALALVQYGYGVFSAWFRDGEIVRRLAAKRVRGRGLLPSPYSVADDAPHELATELVLRGVQSFRSNVLLEGRWHADGGATLKTFFVGHLLFLVPATYRDWRRSNGQAEFPASGFRMLDTPVPAGTERVDSRFALEQIGRRIPPIEMEMFRLQAAGRTTEQIARELGLTIGKVKSDMMRARLRIRRLYPEEARWTG